MRYETGACAAARGGPGPRRAARGRCAGRRPRARRRHGVHSGVRRAAWDPPEPAVTAPTAWPACGFSVAADVADWVPARTGVLWQAPGLAAYRRGPRGRPRATHGQPQLRRATRPTSTGGARADQEAAYAARDSPAARGGPGAAATAMAGGRGPALLLGAPGRAERCSPGSGGPASGYAAGCAAPTSGSGHLPGAPRRPQPGRSAAPGDRRCRRRSPTRRGGGLRPLVEANQQAGRDGAARFGALTRA